MKRSLLLTGAALLYLSACSALSVIGPSPTVGSPAPPFELETPGGETLSLEDFRGQVVLLNFWATWCGPCRLEMPAIQARYERGGFEVLAVDFDEPAEQVAAFMEELGLTFPALLDPGGEIQRLYQVRGYPSSFFVDENGIIRVQHIGIMSEAQLDGYLTEMGVLN
jgi:peroxiredoxin